MLRRVLLPIDGRAAFDTIFPHVRPLRRCGVAELVVMQAHKGDDEPPDSVATCLAKELADEGFQAHIHQRAGDPAEAIVSAATDESVSLIAMATHGRAGASRLAWGSVCESVLRAGNHPMLIERTGAAESHQDNPYRHVLLATDGSERALEVVPWVAAIAKPLAARVTVVHYASDYAGKGAMTEGQAALEAARVALAEHGLEAAVELRRGNAAEGLSRFGWFEPAKGEGVDLIAMCTHGRSGVSRAVLGSVTENVLRHALVPVLAVRAHTAS